jgi:NitT/TauT family transport system permease protein
MAMHLGQRLKFLGLQAFPAVMLVCAWEFAAHRDVLFQFLFASPSSVLRQLFRDLTGGGLAHHFIFTAFESTLGLLLGSTLGSTLGLLLWLSPLSARLAQPYISAIASVPAFALAPMTIIWFGTGVSAKVIMAAVATFFVAIVQAFEGARRTDAEGHRFLQAKRGLCDLRCLCW